MPNKRFTKIIQLEDGKYEAHEMIEHIVIIDKADLERQVADGTDKANKAKDILNEINNIK